jgi:hypothetical protein
VGLFKELYGKNHEDMQESKRAITEKRVMRGFESAIDSMEDKLIDLKESIEDDRLDVANGYTDDIPPMISKQIEIEEIEKQIEMLKAEEKRFFD